MILRTKDDQPVKGSIPCGTGGYWCALPPGSDGSILIASANDPGGWGLAWVAPPRLTTLGTVAFSGPAGFNGATPPAQAASPGVATGTDALVINALALILKNLGFTL